MLMSFIKLFGNIEYIVERNFSVCNRLMTLRSTYLNKINGQNVAHQRLALQVVKYMYINNAKFPNKRKNLLS